VAVGYYLAVLGALGAVAGWDAALRARAATVTPTAVLGDNAPGSLAEAQARVRELQGILDDPEKLQRYLDDKAIREFDEQTPRAIDLAQAPTQPASAPLRVVEYSDMLCPFCRSLAQGLHAWLPTSAGRVAVTFKHYPLDRTCNPGVTRTLHPGACRLALAGVCAHEQGRFWAYHDAVFATELKEAGEADVLRLAQQAGLEVGKLNACMQSVPAQARLRADIEEAQRLGVQATPTVFVNGRKLPSINMFMRAIERESTRLGLPALGPARGVDSPQ
jgi:protein-disulfide isomerase